MDARIYCAYLVSSILAGFLCIGMLGAQPVNVERQMMVIFDDDFTDNGNNWSEGDGEKNSLRVQNGHYWFHHKVEEAPLAHLEKIDITQQQDFAIHTTMTKVSGSRTMDRACCRGKDVE